MAYKEMSFTHKRLTRTGDGAGGKVETPATIGMVTGRKHFYQKVSQVQIEGSEQPVRAVKTEQVVIFDEPSLDIRQHDRLYEGNVPDGEEAGSVCWTVLHVRPYDFQTQADVELVA